MNNAITVREQFEEWCKTQSVGQKHFDLRRFANGKYRNTAVEYCWKAWNAALEKHG